jgi:low affinity Fe/Cu permease
MYKVLTIANSIKIIWTIKINLLNMIIQITILKIDHKMDEKVYNKHDKRNNYKSMILIWDY